MYEFILEFISCFPDAVFVSQHIIIADLCVATMCLMTKEVLNNLP